MADTELLEQIRRLSPSALRLFKQGLPQRLKELDVSRRNDVLSQLQNLPEFADLFEAPVTQRVTPQQPVEDKNLGQKALDVFNAPFEWFGRHVTEPFGAVATAPFTPGLPGGRQPGESPLAYARRQYEQWEEPVWFQTAGGYKVRPTKGLVELLPWLAPTALSAGGAAIARAGGAVGQVGRGLSAVGQATAGIGSVGKATGLAGTLGRAGKVGRVAGRGLEYTPWGLAEKAIMLPFKGVEALARGGGAGKITPRGVERVRKILDKYPEARWASQVEGSVGSPSGLLRLPNKERQKLRAALAPLVGAANADAMRDWRPTKIMSLLEESLKSQQGVEGGMSFAAVGGKSIAPEVAEKWGLTPDDLSSLSGMTPELQALHLHPARMKGFINASKTEIDDYLNKLELQAGDNIEALQAIQLAKDANKYGGLQEAAIAAEKGVGRLHDEELAIAGGVSTRLEVEKAVQETLDMPSKLPPSKPPEPPASAMFGFEEPSIPKKGIQIPESERFVALSNEEIEKSITAMDWQRVLAQWLGQTKLGKAVVEAIGGKAATVTQAVKDTTIRGLIIRTKIEESLVSKGKAKLASLELINPNSARLFGIEEKTGSAHYVSVKPEFAGASKHIIDIAEHPARYNLTAEQSAYIKQHHAISDWVKDGLKEAGIDVKEIKFDELSHWVHRIVTGKLNIDKELDAIRRGAGKIGSRASWEKQRIYETVAEGIKAGNIYEPNLERIQSILIQSAARRIADTRLAGMIAPLSRSTGVFSLPKAITLVNAALRKIPVKESSLKAIERDIPTVARSLRAALSKKDWTTQFEALQQVRKDLATFVPTEEEKLYLIVEKLTAQRKTAENAVAVIQRALRGETIPTGTVKAIGKILPEIKDQLGANTKRTLEDLVKAGVEAQKPPITITVKQAIARAEIYKKALEDVEEALAKDPKNGDLVKQASKLRSKIGLNKFVIAGGETKEFPKSATSILSADRKQALQEMLDKVRGTPYEAKTATGKRVVRYKGGVIKELRAKELKAQELRARVKERVAQPILGVEATIQHPAFQGRIFPIEVRDAIEKYWADRGWKPLQIAATASGEMRTLVAAGDFSPPFIQGAALIALHPQIWAKGVKEGLKAFTNTKSLQQYMVNNQQLFMERANSLGYTGGFEMMESMPLLRKQAEVLASWMKRPVGSGGFAVEQTYGRFEAFFTAFGDVVRNEMWKALRGRATNQQELIEIARHIDRMTGVMSTKALGIGKTQRDIEQGFLFFAARYTRAGFALVGDAFKGGITGHETRKALVSMLAAGVAAYWAIAKALGQEPEFDPSTGRFMTIEIKDPFTGDARHVGIGGMMTSLIRFGADITASAAGMGQNEPLDFVKMNRFDNPFLKFMYSKSAPLTGFIGGLTSGTSYFGEPFENAQDYADFIASQVLPIALQSIGEEGKFTTAGLVTEELGLRTFPQSDWEKRDALRNEVAQRTYGMRWTDVGTNMGRLYQEQLEQQNPDLQDLTLRADESQAKRARGEGLVWNSWRKEGKDIEESYRRAIKLASDEFTASGDGVKFREKVDDISATRRALYARREQNPSYVEVYQFFNEPMEASVAAKTNPKDLARREYYKLLYAPDMYDEFGNYDFIEADKREDYIGQQYGQEVLDYIQEYMGTKWPDAPPALKALQEVKQMLEPYWAVEGQIWAGQSPELGQIAERVALLERIDSLQAKRLLAQYPQIVWVRIQIANQRKQMKLQNPEIAQALRMFYSF